MFAFVKLTLFHRNSLRNKIGLFARFAIIISPTVNYRQVAWPVAVARNNWSCPFQGICFPRILTRFGSFAHAVEEVHKEYNLSQHANNSEAGNNNINVLQLSPRCISIIGVIPAWYTG